MRSNEPAEGRVELMYDDPGLEHCSPIRESGLQSRNPKQAGLREELSGLLNQMDDEDALLLIPAIKDALKRLHMLKANPTRKRSETIGRKYKPISIFSGLPDLGWNEIELIFTCDEGLLIRCRKREARIGFEALGFADRRSVGKPDTLWWLLRSLADYNGAIPWKNNLAANRMLPKRIQLLRDRLQSVTGLKTDPFYPYRKNGEYKVRFKIRAQTRCACENASGETLSETSEFLKEEVNRYRKHKTYAT